ncbi:MAG: hypothetical protein JSS09_03755, partial [Verrucomicrobia bacterium]|nr:hypothetical protein [Verrucomicrobiota bacterium]
MINNIIRLKLESFLKEKHGISSTDPSTGIVLSVALFSLSILVFTLRKEPDLIASKDMTNNPSDSTTSKTSPLIQKRLSSTPPQPKEILVANNPVISIQDVTSQQSRMSPTTVTLPKRTWDLYDPLFLLSRQIESQYHSLPWPPQIQNMTIFTRVAGGRGDIAAAAHVIDLLQNIQPTLKFNWLLHGAVSIQDMDAVQKK